MTWLPWLLDHAALLAMAFLIAFHGVRIVRAVLAHRARSRALAAEIRRESFTLPVCTTCRRVLESVVVTDPARFAPCSRCGVRTPLRAPWPRGVR